MTDSDANPSRNELLQEVEYLRAECAALRAQLKTNASAHQAQVEQERTLFRILIDHLPHYIYIKDTESRFLNINQACLRILGVDQVEEVIGKTDFDFYPPDRAQQYFSDEQTVLSSGKALINREELLIEQVTHDERWMLTTKVPYIDEEGHIAGIVGISVDITALKQAHLDLETAHETLETLIAERTAELHAANQKLQDEIGERQQTERTLRDERNLLHTLIDSLLDEVYVKDRQSRFLIVNKAATRIVNVPSPDDMIGKTDFDFYPPELAQKYYDDEQRVMATGQPIINQEEHFIHHTSGKEGWMLTTKIPLHNVDGEISGLIGVGRDITRRKTPELQALQWMIDQERVSLTREFIKNISHDVKSPLTVIRNNLYLLEHLQDDSEEYKTKVNIVRQQADLLERYIKDILTISRLDQQEDIDRQPVDLSHIINDILERYRPVAAHKHIQLSIDLAALPTIDVDQIELRRALVNIVENAITYTQPHGTIAISASFAAGYVTITVADTGIGIPTGDLDKIFRRFYRVDKARNTELGGTGLGLAIAQTIINMHNGLIEVESELGVGTTFHVKLPVNPASSEHNTDHNLAAE